MRWFVSSALALAVAASSPTWVRAQDPAEDLPPDQVGAAASQQQQPAETEVEHKPLSPDFLALPALDLQWSLKSVKPSKKQPETPEKPKVGDTIQLRLAGIPEGSPKELKIQAPEGIDLAKEGWEIDPDSVKLEPSGELAFEANALKPGKLALPTLAVAGPDGKAVLRTNPLEVEVESAIPKSDPKPNVPEGLRPPMGIPFPWWILVLAGALAAAILGVAGWYAYRWYRKWNARVNAPAPLPPKPEHEVALAALDELERQGYPARREFKKHYFAASEILKIYIGARYRFDAPESTTSEMIRTLEERSGLSLSMLDRVQGLFERMDRVKFTDHVPEEGEPARILEEARKFVTTTRRLPEVAPVMAPSAAGTPGKEANAPR